MQFHAVASVFPMMSDAEIKDLAADIRANGLIEAIWTYRGEIVDGRNRYRACQIAGEEPRYQEWKGDEKDLVGFVLSLNLKRRHLNVSQLSVIGLAIEKYEAVRAKERQAINALTNQPQNVVKIPPSEMETGKARDIAAAAVGVSPSYIQAAKRIEVQAPDLIPEIQAGNMNIPQAKREMVRRERQERAIPEAPLPTSKEVGYTVKRGQVWKCGRHTVICGDCYEWLDRLEADALITDPPYGIDYRPNWNKWDGSPSDFAAITGDDEEFNPAPFLDFPTVLLFGANYYSPRLPVGGWLCWDKRTKEELDAMIGSPFELAWYRSQHTTRKAVMVRVQHGGVVNADSVSGNNEKRYHATQKPIALMLAVLEALTVSGDTVLDPFSGVGSTLLACERRGNTCTAIEVEPENVAIILQRYEKETGGKPCLESSE